MVEDVDWVNLCLSHYGRSEFILSKLIRWIAADWATGVRSQAERFFPPL
jgi:hypothetical protein